MIYDAASAIQNTLKVEEGKQKSDPRRNLHEYPQEFGRLRRTFINRFMLIDDANL